MANDAHLKEIKLGATHWNNWRKRHFAEQPDLSGADLSGLNLSGVNLIGANLSKTNLSLANLNGAFLSCADLSQAYLSEAKLHKANLSKANATKADLSFADLSAATLIETDFNRATLIEANLSSANLSFADLNRANCSKIDLQGANLTKCILIETTLNQANLRSSNLNQAIASEASLREANLAEARLNKVDFSFANLIEANLRRANLSKAILIEANLRGAILREAALRKCRLGRANLGSADLSEADLSEANLAGSDLIRANLAKATCIDANLSEVALSGANLTKAILTRTNLNEANLSEADLTRTDFRQANLTHADLTRSTVAATNFSGATLSGICLEDAQLSSTTKLEGVSCAFIYLKRNNQERRPSEGEFVKDEFAQLFYSTLETINLTLHAGVNWTAFAQSINVLNQTYQTARLGIQAIENKGDGIILLKLSTAPGVDTVLIHRDFMRIYEETKQRLEQPLALNSRDALLGHEASPGIHPSESINQLFELLTPTFGSSSGDRTPNTSLKNGFLGHRQNAEPSTAKSTDIVTELGALFADLAQRYPDATEPQRMIVAALEIQHHAKRDALFKQKLVKSLQTGSLLIDQVLHTNPFIQLEIETLRDWLEPEPFANTASSVSISS
ncbi:MAG TPA: pentapeptide repeat-containing protein [Stenomitos sp.]